MLSYLDVHNSLRAQRYRVTSLTSGYVSSQGARVIIVGDTDSGKSTLAKMLLSWAAKEGCKPTFVDLNVGQSSITIPGTIAATSITRPLDPVEGFPLDKALVHYYGHKTPSINLGLYKSLVEGLARELEEEFAGKAKSQASGMVIDTMGWIVGIGYELLIHTIKRFNASVVIVLGQEAELVSKLRFALRLQKHVQVLNLEKPAGVFIRSSGFRKTLRTNNIKSYFHGATNNLTVYTKTAKFGDMQVYQIGDFKESDSRSAPQQRGNNPLKIISVEIGEHLLSKILAISYAQQPHQIISSIVAGFVCITDVDIGKQMITFISPSVMELPSKILILGTLTWHET